MDKLNVLKALDLIFPSNCAMGWTFSFSEELLPNGTIRLYINAICEDTAFLSNQHYRINVTDCKNARSVVATVIDYLNSEHKYAFKETAWNVEEEL